MKFGKQYASSHTSLWISLLKKPPYSQPKYTLYNQSG